MVKVPLNDNYDLRTAVFWVRFASEIGHQRNNCPTVSLYETTDGEFFVVEQGSPSVAETMAEPITDPKEWLTDQIERMADYILS